MEQDNEIKESSGTDSSKATDINYRSFVEEPKKGIQLLQLLS